MCRLQLLLSVENAKNRLGDLCGHGPFVKKINNGVNLQMSQNVQLKTWEKMATIKKLYKV